MTSENKKILDEFGGKFYMNDEVQEILKFLCKVLESKDRQFKKALPKRVNKSVFADFSEKDWCNGFNACLNEIKNNYKR